MTKCRWGFVVRLRLPSSMTEVQWELFEDDPELAEALLVEMQIVNMAVKRLRRIKEEGMSLPDDYFCPKCTTKAVKDMAYYLRGVQMPTSILVHTALSILVQAECPQDLMGSLAVWAKKYRRDAPLGGLSEEEVDKLKLLAWKRATSEHPNDEGREA